MNATSSVAASNGTRSLKVAVCVKQVLDPEAPATLLEANAETLTVSGRGVSPALDPYSMHALRAALDLREQLAGAVDITVLGTGKAPSKNQYLKALAAGADRAVLLDTPLDPAAFTDPVQTAHKLHALLTHCSGLDVETELPGRDLPAEPHPPRARAGAQEEGTTSSRGFDLVLTGRRAADTNAGAVGPALAEMLGWPVVTLATALRLGPAGQAEDLQALDGAEPASGPGAPGRSVIVERLGPDGLETVSCPLPAVVTVSHEAGEVPIVEFAKMIEAKRKPFEVLKPGALGLIDTRRPQAAQLEITSISKPTNDRPCELIEAASARDSGRALAARLA